MACCTPQTIGTEPASEFIFPVSRHTQTRRLVLRNPTNEGFAVKIRTSCPQALQIEARNVLVHANEWLAVPITLDISKLDKPDSLQYHTLSIYCRSGQVPVKQIREWYAQDADDSLYLALTLKLARSNGFAAPDTVVDLPGSSTLLETPPYPTYGVDDSDCRTAHRFDSDTATATEISDDDFAAVAPDSLVSTAHNIDSGMPTARHVNDHGWCSLGTVLNTIYPSSGRLAKTTNKKGAAENNNKDQKFAIFPCGAN